MSERYTLILKEFIMSVKTNVPHIATLLPRTARTAGNERAGRHAARARHSHLT